MAKYRPKIVNQIVGLVKSDTYTIAEICRQVGITPKTFHQWKEEHPEFGQMIVDAKDERMQFFVQEAKKSLLKKIQGYDVTENLDYDHVSQPPVLILDSGDNLEELDLCKKIKNSRNFVNSKIIVTTTVHDKTAVLDSGADLYLPKPYELSDLIRWVEYFVKKI